MIANMLVDPRDGRHAARGQGQLRRGRLVGEAARPGAHASMPLTWDQVKAGLDPARYTVRTVPGLLRQTKAWEGYDDAAGSIADAIKKLGKRAEAA